MCVALSECLRRLVVCVVLLSNWLSVSLLFFFQAEDGIRDLVRSRGLGDVYKRQVLLPPLLPAGFEPHDRSWLSADLLQQFGLLLALFLSLIHI